MIVLNASIFGKDADDVSIFVTVDVQSNYFRSNQVAFQCDFRASASVSVTIAEKYLIVDGKEANQRFHGAFYQGVVSQLMRNMSDFCAFKIEDQSIKRKAFHKE